MKLSKKKLLELRKKNKKIKSKKIIKGTSEKPRLAIYRSNQNIYAQLIDDIKNVTLISCSTLDRSMKESISVGKTIDASRLIGTKLAELSLKKNIKTIIFDRGPYLYHGRIKALAEGARDGGLQF